MKASLTSRIFTKALVYSTALLSGVSAYSQDPKVDPWKMTPIQPAAQMQPAVQEQDPRKETSQNYSTNSVDAWKFTPIEAQDTTSKLEKEASNPLPVKSKRKFLQRQAGYIDQYRRECIRDTPRDPKENLRLAGENYSQAGKEIGDIFTLGGVNPEGERDRENDLQSPFIKNGSGENAGRSFSGIFKHAGLFTYNVVDQIPFRGALPTSKKDKQMTPDMRVFYHAANIWNSADSTAANTIDMFTGNLAGNAINPIFRTKNEVLGGLKQTGSAPVNFALRTPLGTNYETAQRILDYPFAMIPTWAVNIGQEDGPGNLKDVNYSKSLETKGPFGVKAEFLGAAALKAWTFYELNSGNNQPPNNPPSSGVSGGGNTSIGGQ